MTKKNLLLVRAMTVFHDIEGLKQLITQLKEGSSKVQEQNVVGFSILVQYFVQNKIDENFINKSLGLLDTDISQVEQNEILMCLLTYYLLATEDYNNLLKLLNKTNNPEQ